MSQLIIRPISNFGTQQNLRQPSATASWDCVNEVTQNSDTDYIYNAVIDTISVKTDRWNLSNHTTETGSINFILIRGYFRYQLLVDAAQARLGIRIGSTDYFGTLTNLDPVWTQITKQYNTNPSTSLAFTWTEIDALVGVVELTSNAFSGGDTESRCTQYEIVIDYTASSTINDVIGFSNIGFSVNNVDLIVSDILSTTSIGFNVKDLILEIQRLIFEKDFNIKTKLLKDFNIKILFVKDFNIKTKLLKDFSIKTKLLKDFNIKRELLKIFEIIKS